MRTVLIYRSLLLPYSETFIREQAKFLQNWRGVLVGRKLVHQLSLEGLETQILGQTPTVIGSAVNSVRWRLGIAPSLRVLRNLEPHLLHAHFGVDAVEALPIVDELNIPMLVTLHGYDVTIRRDWWESGSAGRRMRNYPNRLLSLGERKDVHFVAVSDALRKRAIEFGIPKSKIVTSYIGIDTQTFSPSGQRINLRKNQILFVGRLVEKKGCEFLIRAMKLVQLSTRDAHLVIVGDGHLKNELQALAARLGVSVEFLGAQSSLEVQALLARSRVLCLPSIKAPDGDLEGFGLVLLEAQASGVPVVTSAFGGATEGILNGKTGYAVCPEDVVAIADSLAKLLADQDLLTAMSDSARKFAVEKFDIRKLTRKLEDIYERVSLNVD